MTPDLSFLTVADRPDALRLLIACLRLQTNPAWELLVLDQTPDAACLAPVKEAKALGEERISWDAVPRIGDIGQSMRAAYTRFARGEFLCFPHDDAYYVPVFVEKMLLYARTNAWELVYCDWLFDRADNTTPYHHWPGVPTFGRVDMGGFIVTKAALLADGWGDHGEGGDGRLVERIAEKHRHGCVPDNRVLYVKNAIAWLAVGLSLCGVA